MLPTLGYLKKEGPRAETWRRIFGDTTIPLASPVAFRIETPDGPKKAYKVDVRALTEQQRARAISHLAETFRIPVDEIQRELDGDHGLPILADDICVSFDLRLLL